MFFVKVGHTQNKHFEQVVLCLQALGCEWANRSVGDFHVMFGPVLGMSTRRGNIVFLSDIIDEGTQQVLDVMARTESEYLTYICHPIYIYCICPNISTVRECKGLGAHLLISIINPVVRYLLCTYIW